MARLALRRVMNETSDIIPIWWDRQPDVPSPGAEDRYNLMGGNDNTYAVFGGNLFFSDYQCNYFSFIESYDALQDQVSPVSVDLQFTQGESNNFELEANVTMDYDLLAADAKLFFIVTCDTLVIDPDERADAEWSFRVLAMSDYIDFNLSETGQNATFTQTFQIDEFDYIDVEDYHAIAIIQNHATSEIIQAKRVILGSLLNSNDEIYQFDYSLSNYPNPFNPTTTISFNLSSDSDVSIDIFNLKGQKVRTLLSERMVAGRKSEVWRGDDINGIKVSSGVYLYILRINNQVVAVKKCLLMK